MTERDGKVGKNWLIGILSVSLGVLILGWANGQIANDKEHGAAITELKTSFAVINEKLDRLLTGTGG